jgi:hypothetical protein
MLNIFTFTSVTFFNYLLLVSVHLILKLAIFAHIISNFKLINNNELQNNK